jgi:hypothetical protein
MVNTNLDKVVWLDVRVDDAVPMDELDGLKHLREVSMMEASKNKLKPSELK